MKFTKEDACKELAKRLSETKLVEDISKWDRTINENVETLFSLLGENSEIELTAFIDNAIPLFKTTAGFMRKENADLAKSYEEKIKNLSPKKVEEEPDQTKKAFEERLKAIEEELSAEKMKNIISGKKKDFLSKAKDAGIDNNEWLEAMLEKTVFSENTDVDNEVKSFVDIYNKFNSNIKKTPTPYTPRGSGGSDVDEVVAAAAELVKQNIY